MNSSIRFLNRECRNYNHVTCHGMWEGLGLYVICNCTCHKKMEVEIPFQGGSNSAKRSSTEEEIV